jgi:putative ABC transport system permease protein
MRLLRLLSLPYARKHRLRCLLTAAGIALGVTVLVGMHTANQSVLAGFRQTVDRVSGTTQLQISAGDAGFEESVLERVQALPEVRVAAPVIEAVVDSGMESAGRLLVLGVDMLGDRSLRNYDLEEHTDEVIDDPLVFLAQPDSLIISRRFAEANGLGHGSRLTMRTMDGDKRFTVRGIMKAGGLAGAFGGNLAVMDVYSAQKVFGRGRMFDRIDVALQEGVRIEEAQEKLKALLGPGFEVEPPAARGERFEAIARNFSVSINFSSVFALLIGLFIIYNAFSIAVAQRRAEIGILRALGATRHQIRNLFLMEGAVVGVAGSAAGVITGAAVARAVAAYLSEYMGSVYGVAQKAEDLSSDPRLLGGAFALGVATSVMAAWVPARQAASVDPVQALQKGRFQCISEREARWRAAAALAVLAIVLVALRFRTVAWLFYAAFAGLVLAAILMTPLLARVLTRALRPLLAAMRPVEGALAADSLLAAPRRTSATVGALMLSLALTVGSAGMAQSSRSAIVEWVDQALNPDLYVSASDSIVSRGFRFDPSLGARLRAVEGVEEVQMVRSPRVTFRGIPIMLISMEVESLARRVRRRVVAGDPETMWREAAAGRGAIISENLAIMQGLRVGDVVEIPATHGVLRLPVAGVVVDFSDQRGSVLVDRKVYVKYWGDETVNTFRVYVRKGAAPEEVARRIQSQIGGGQRLFVFTNREVRKYILKVTDQWFGLSYVQLAVAGLVAVLGIINTLTVSITDRRRELAVLQAVGALRRQVRQAVWMEAVAVGVIGLALGLGLGGVMLHYIHIIIRDHVAGMNLQYIYPAETAAMLAPVILAAAFFSALGPAETAVRGSLVEALEYE